MTGATHKKFAVAAAFTASVIINKDGITDINYYLTLPILLSTAKYGALFPDVDHTWQNVKEKTVPNWIINKIIHITGGKHRSWQTHSWDIALIFALLAFFIPKLMLKNQIITEINYEVLQLILYGFTFGWISHLFSDMLTSAGVRVFSFSKVKIALVPKRIGKLVFNTGNDWEALVYKIMSIVNILYGFYIVLYPLIINNIIKNIILNIGGSI